MHKSIVTLLCASTLSVLALLPAAATDPDGSHGTIPVDFNLKDSIHETGDFLLWLPVRAPAAAVATVVGTPIAIFRKECEEIAQTVKGGINHPMVLLPALTLGVPSAAIGAFFDGLCAGPYDACANGKHPFSKEAFSLGEEMYDSYHYDHE